MAEQPAPDFGERQDAGDYPAALGDEIMRPMPKDVGEYFPPPDAVKERRIRAVLDERIPAGRISGSIWTHDCPLGKLRHPFRVRHHSPPFRNTRSARSHGKSATSRRSLDSVCLR